MIFTDQNAPIGYTPHKFKQQQPKPNASNLVAAREPEVKIILKPIEKHHGANYAMPYRPCAFKVFKHNFPSPLAWSYMYVRHPSIFGTWLSVTLSCMYIQQHGLSPLFIWFDPDHVQENEAFAAWDQLSEVGSSYHTSGEHISLRGGFKSSQTLWKISDNIVVAISILSQSLW